MSGKAVVTDQERKKPGECGSVEVKLMQSKLTDAVTLVYTKFLELVTLEQRQREERVGDIDPSRAGGRVEMEMESELTDSVKVDTERVCPVVGGATEHDSVEVRDVG